LFLNLFITITIAYTPASRYYQGSVIIENKIYFLGGIDISGKGTSDLFYLDVSFPFNSANPKWTDLTSVAPIPVTSAFAPSCVGGSNNSTIFLFEHRRTNNANSTSLVTFTFDTSSQKWTAPTMSGVIPPPRQDMRAVVDKTGKIYITGGFEPYTTFKSYNNTYILDSLSLSWTNGVNALLVRSAYTATLLPSGDIVYIGGVNDDPSPEINMNSLSIYSTNTGSWTSMIATGDVIAVRQSHTAVLNKDGSIIIYGGASNNYTAAPNPSLAVLDTNYKPYRWSAKQFTSSFAPPPLAYHSAHIVGDYMIIAF
ncbi:33415_t:CDS:2, partial [Racocetra persica]